MDFVMNTVDFEVEVEVKDYLVACQHKSIVDHVTVDNVFAGFGR